MAARVVPKPPRAARRAAAPRRIVMFAYPDVQLLDVTGPLEIFAAASRLLARRAEDGAAANGGAGGVGGVDGERARGGAVGADGEVGAGGEGAARGPAADRPAPPAYTPEIVAPEAGPLRASSGLEIVASRSLRTLRGEIDTLIVAGGEGSRTIVRDARTIAWLRRVAPRPRRLASVCTGALLLAEAGLLDGRRATTHWAWCDWIAARHPRVSFDPDPIFVRDGRIWTSAGVTAGIDLALALVEEDHGRALALEVARHMVVFMKRPGGQSQFSAQLVSPLPESEPLRRLQAWVMEHPDADLTVEALARRVAMSPRHFARVFAAEVGTTPARFVERARVEAARRALEDSNAGVEGIAAACGFGSAETMRRAFLRTLRVGPAEYRSRFRGGDRLRAAG